MTDDYRTQPSTVQTQGDVLDDLNTTGANAADNEILVGTGAGALAWVDAKVNPGSLTINNRSKKWQQNLILI